MELKALVTVVTTMNGTKSFIMMRKSIYPLAAITLMAFSVISCQKDKEESFTQFTAGMEHCADQQGAKTYLDGTILKWVEGDRVKIYGRGGSGATCVVSSTDATGTFSTLDYVRGELGFTPYKAIYPEKSAVTKSAVTIPSAQISVDGRLTGFPMYAESATDEFRFKNLCGVLKVRLQQANTAIQKISVTADNICGVFNIEGTSDQPVATYANHGGNMITLKCLTAQDISDGHDFYIYLPAGTYSTMQLKITNSDGYYCIKSGSNVRIERSKYSTIRVNNLVFDQMDERDISGCLNGVFSVSPSKQVRFAKGNLQYQSWSGSWRFADNQYDMVASPTQFRVGGWFSVYPGNVEGSDHYYMGDAAYTGWIDMFYWSTPLSNFGIGLSSIDESDNFKDYGLVFGVSSTWRTLSKEEWEYLIWNRPNANNLYGTGSIVLASGDAVNGIFILPDNWVSIVGSNFNPGTSSRPDGSFDDYRQNTFSLSEWVVMEESGALFLPACGGQRDGNICHSAGTDGRYWTSTYDQESQSYLFDFDGRDISVYSEVMDGAHAVRLCQDVE